MKKLSQEQIEERKADHELMQQVARREPGSLEILSERFGGLIYTTIFKVLNNVEDTKDVAQEVLLQLWKKADTYKPQKGKLMTWIATLARNRAIDRFRSHQRRSRLNDTVEEQSKAEFEPRRSQSGRESLYRSEARQILEGAVMELNTEQREVIELAYFEGLTQSQIARRLKRPLGTVKARIRRGVQNLRGVVKNRLDEDMALDLPSPVA